MLHGVVHMQEHKEDIWDGSNVLAVMAGSASDDLRYLKSVSLHLWLFGYEVTGVCLCAFLVLLLLLLLLLGSCLQSRRSTTQLQHAAGCRDALFA